MTDRTDRAGPAFGGPADGPPYGGPALDRPRDGGAPVTVAGAPAIPGLRFRTYRGPIDAAALVAVENAELAADGIDELYTAEGLAVELECAGNETPERELVIAEVDDVPVAYARRSWRPRGDVRVYEHAGRVHPAWRRRGLGRALLRHQASALRDLASAQAHVGEVALGSWTDERNTGATALLLAEGYRPIRWYVDMVRPSIDPVAEVPVPDGIRIVAPDPADRGSLLTLLALETEAFRDHWGAHPTTDAEKAGILADPAVDPALWRVAWDGDDIAGLVRPIVFTEENEAFGRHRIWIDTLSVRRPWRRRGLARALLTAALVAGRERELTSAGLSVDTDNTTGALALYERLGFVRQAAAVAYRKPLEDLST
ncbi:MAG: GNAT family N-acetyltransferase [Chloroflexota bacterium]